jgi:hypothetical protein
VTTPFCKFVEKIGPGPFVLRSNERFYVFNPSIIQESNNLIIVARLSSTTKCRSHYNEIPKKDKQIDEILNVFDNNYKFDSSVIIMWNYNSSPYAYTVFNNYTTENNNRGYWGWKIQGCSSTMEKHGYMHITEV